MLAQQTEAGRFTIARAFVARGFLILAIPVQVLALTTMQVFVTNHPSCESAPFILPCSPQMSLTPLNAQTAWQLLTFGHLTWVAGGLLLAAVLSVASTMLPARALAGVAIIATTLWVGWLALFIAQNVPDPSMQHIGWAAFLSLVALTSLLWLVANVLSLIWQRLEQIPA